MLPLEYHATKFDYSSKLLFKTKKTTVAFFTLASPRIFSRDSSRYFAARFVAKIESYTRRLAPFQMGSGSRGKSVANNV